jgi:hypothetical protein
MTDMTVASTIAEQIGGLNRLARMTGCSGFVGSDDSLMFKLGSGSVCMVNGEKINKMVIRLTAMDTYEVKTFRVRGTAVVELETREVYAEDLMDTFERMTGMYLTFGRRK